MEEQFILRVPPSVAERIERLMNESAAASSSSNPDDTSLDLSFSGQRRPPSLSLESCSILCENLPCIRLAAFVEAVVPLLREKRSSWIRS